MPSRAQNLTKIGLIGGMSWFSTSEYYKAINEIVQRERGGHTSAPLVLESLNFEQIRQFQVDNDWDGAAQLLAAAARNCARAGAAQVLICTNLMHKVAASVERSLDVPLLHIADAIAAAALAHGWRRVGLLATRWVMEEDFYLQRLRNAGLEVVVPEPEHRVAVDRIIFDELTQGVITDESRRRYEAVVDDLATAGAQAVILGCTEIELLLTDGDCPIPLLDSMRTHAQAAAAVILGTNSPSPGLLAVD